MLWDGSKLYGWPQEIDQNQNFTVDFKITDPTFTNTDRPGQEERTISFVIKTDYAEPEPEPEPEPDPEPQPEPETETEQKQQTKPEKKQYQDK